MKTRAYSLALSLVILLLAACSTTPAPATPIPSATSAPVAVIPSATSLPDPTAPPTAAPTSAPEPTAVPAPPTAEPTSVPEPPTAEPTSAPEPTAVPAPPAPILLKSGLFGVGTEGYSAIGTAALVQQPDGTVLLQFNEFQTQWGPDVFVYLSGSTYPLSGAEMNAGGALEIARLSSHTNPAQTYLLAPGDYSAYQSVVIWCRAFDHVFSAATLQ